MQAREFRLTLFLIVLVVLFTFCKSQVYCPADCANLPSPCNCFVGGNLPPSVPANCCGEASPFWDTPNSPPQITFDIIIKPANATNSSSTDDTPETIGTNILNAYIFGNLELGWDIIDLQDANALNSPLPSAAPSPGATTTGSGATTTGSGATTTGNGGDGATTTGDGGTTSDGKKLFNFISSFWNSKNNEEYGPAREEEKRIHPRQQTAIINANGESILRFTLSTYLVTFNQAIFRQMFHTQAIKNGGTFDVSKRTQLSNIIGGAGPSDLYGVVGLLQNPQGNPASILSQCFLQVNISATNALQGPDSQVVNWPITTTVLNVQPIRSSGLFYFVFKSSGFSTDVGLSCRLSQATLSLPDAYFNSAYTFPTGVNSLNLLFITMTQKTDMVR